MRKIYTAEMHFLRTVAEYRMSDRESNERIRDEVENTNLLNKGGCLRVTISVCCSREIELNICIGLSINKMKDWKKYDRRKEK
jgi:hypothetical protein